MVFRAQLGADQYSLLAAGYDLDADGKTAYVVSTSVEDPLLPASAMPTSPHPAGR